MNDASSILSALRRFAAARAEARRFAALAWLGAPLVRASLATAGLRRTLRLIQALPMPRLPRPLPVDPGAGAALVAGAFRFHFVGGACLPQAVLQYAIHRCDGVPARLVVGVCRPGDGRALDAHAWVEGDSSHDRDERAAIGPRPRSPSGALAPTSRFTPIFVQRAGDQGA